MIFNREKKEAFTLIETVVALAVIVIVFTAVFKMHSQSISMSEYVRFYTTAPMLAQYKICDAQMSKEPLSSESGTFDEDSLSGYSWEIKSEDATSDAKGYTYNFKKIEVIISYYDYKYQISTYKYFDDLKK